MARRHRGSWGRYDEREFFVYLLLADDGEVLYVGRSHNPRKRAADHMKRRALGWTKRVARIRQIGPHFYPETFRLEVELIEMYQPVGNVMHTKNYTHPSARRAS
ncbi:GIY-YIG nuclease family protein [Pimelobacter simplex]|uniref:GIY-YIG nuclease family protein n=1 Tax=Nocardioides simplex TaxID=2045 RepID=UPI003AAC5FFE